MGKHEYYHGALTVQHQCFVIKNYGLISIAKISQLLNVKYDAVWYYIQRKHISKKFDKTLKNQLEYLYINQDMTQKQVAIYLGKTEDQVKHYMRYFNIKKFHKIKSHHPLYSHYVSMKKRCYVQSTPYYKNYGGRGITVCDRWLGKRGFWNFVEDVPPKPTPEHTLDRIDNNGDYCPGNVQWATRSEQQKNRRKYHHNRKKNNIVRNFKETE